MPRSVREALQLAVTILAVLALYLMARQLLGLRQRTPEKPMLLIALAAAAAVSASPLGSIDPLASRPLSPVASDHAPGSCHFGRAANGAPLPDPTCTPGAINPTLTLKVLQDPAFRTDLVRDKLTSAAAKRKVYAWYGVAYPANNKGATQTCEIDHVIDLSAGGADSLQNLWPQCQGPNDPPVAVGERWFKQKDRFAEHYVIDAIKHGLVDEAGLAALQRAIAADWTLVQPVEPQKASPAEGVRDDISPNPAE